MRIRLAVALVALLGGCATEPLATSGAESLTIDQASVVAALGDRVIVRGVASSPLAQTDERPTYEMELRTPDLITQSPGRVLTGALVRDGAVWVLPDGTLEHDDGRLIDRDVVPELSVDADGSALAYPRHTRAGGGVVVLDLQSGERRVVTGGLAVADRPIFLPDARLVVVGAHPSGISGIWIADPSGIAAPIPVTNAELRVGRPFGARFVPPPAYHASMRVEGSTLVYDDGRGEQRVTLPRGQ